MNKSGAAKAKATAAVKIQDAEIQLAWAEADTMQLGARLDDANRATQEAEAKAKAGFMARILM